MNESPAASQGGATRSRFIRRAGIAGAAVAVPAVVAKRAAAFNNPEGPLRIVSDTTTTSGDGGCQLIIDNVTANASPAQTARIGLKKDGTLRWVLSIDETVGSQGDFSFYHNDAGTPANGRDILYVTDEQYPKVAINGDRYSPATLTIYGHVAERPVLHLSAASGQTAPLIQIYGGDSVTRLLVLEPNGDLRIAGALRSSVGGDLTIDVGANAIKGGNNSVLKLYDGLGKLGATLSAANGLTLDPAGAAKIKSLDGNEIVISKPVWADSHLVANYANPAKRVVLGYNQATGQTGPAMTFANDANLYRPAAGMLKTDGAFVIGGNIGFYGASAAPKPTVQGSMQSNAALASLVNALATLGLITDSTS